VASSNSEEVFNTTLITELLSTVLYCVSKPIKENINVSEELKSGNIDKCQEIVIKIKATNHKLSTSDKEKLDYLETSIFEAERGREELKKYKEA